MEINTGREKRMPKVLSRLYLSFRNSFCDEDIDIDLYTYTYIYIYPDGQTISADTSTQGVGWLPEPYWNFNHCLSDFLLDVDW